MHAAGKHSGNQFTHGHERTGAGFRGKKIMTRRIVFMLTAMTLGLMALPEAGFAQSDPFTGLWQLNLAKSKFSPGPPPKSLTDYTQGEGQNRKLTAVSIDAEGNPSVVVFMHIYDGQPHPSTGIRDFDASIYTRVDAYTVNVSRTKAGKLVQTETIVVSPDGKTKTATRTGTDADGRQINVVAVYDKQ